MKSIEVKPIDVGKVEQETSDVVTLYDKSNALIVSNQDEYESAADILKVVKARAKELEAERKEITNPLDAAKKAVMDLFRKPLDLLASAESVLKRSMISYTEAQERKAREEQERLRKLAEKEAEIERKKLEAKIERARASGKDEKAEELETQKENIQPIIVPLVAPQVETPKGVAYKEKWTATVIDFKLLPDEYKLPNQSALDKVAQATKGSIQIPGVKFQSEKILASRSM